MSFRGTMAEEHPFTGRGRRGRRREWALAFGLRAVTYLILAAAIYIFVDIAVKGAPVVLRAAPPFVNVGFLTRAPETLHVFEHGGARHEMGHAEFERFKAERGLGFVRSETRNYSAGGIFPCIVGTVLLVIGSTAIAMALGVCSAVYLSEYARGGRLLGTIRLSIANLAGVPSVVFGIFGVGLFVLFLGWGQSLLAGCFTLACMALPIIITASEESLRAVPRGLREGSLALGATRWQTIRRNVLPYALPGILTSSVLAITRVAGETAPIMFTAAFAHADRLPWQGNEHWWEFLFRGVMALPYHIYVVSAKVPSDEYTRRMQYGAVFVFMVLVFLLALFSFWLRNRVRSRGSW